MHFHRSPSLVVPLFQLFTIFLYFPTVPPGRHFFQVLLAVCDCVAAAFISLFLIRAQITTAEKLREREQGGEKE